MAGQARALFTGTERHLSTIVTLRTVVPTLLGVTVLAGCAAMSVHVTKFPLGLQQGSYVADKQENDCYSAAGVGRTRWNFECRPVFTYDLKSAKETGNTTTATIVLRKADVNLSLIVTVLQKQPELQSHERGHLQICERIYDNAETAAKASCEAAIGKTYSADGANQSVAVQKALQIAAQEICLQYKRRTHRVADLVSLKYDELTGRGRNDVSPESAVVKAFAEISAQHPGKQL